MRQYWTVAEITKYWSLLPDEMLLLMLLSTLELYSNIEENNSPSKGITILHKYIDSSLINHPKKERIPTNNIILHGIFNLDLTTRRQLEA